MIQLLQFPTVGIIVDLSTDLNCIFNYQPGLNEKKKKRGRTTDNKIIQSVHHVEPWKQFETVVKKNKLELEMSE